jgi:phosphoribosylanthranilate isomerase
VVYAGGPRKVSDTEVREVVAAAGGHPVMAVWGAPDLDAILRSRDAAGFSGVQLHGGGDVALAHRLKQEGLLVWRVARLGGPDDLTTLAELMNEANAVLVEPRVPGKEGGAGVALDLDLAQGADTSPRPSSPPSMRWPHCMTRRAPMPRSGRSIRGS